MIIKTCLEAVKDHVAEKFPECVCRRAWAAESSRQYIGSLETPLVSVVLANRSGTIINRETKEVSLDVFIVIQKKLKSGSADIDKLTEEIDPLVEIMEQLFDMFLVPVNIEKSELQITCKRPVHDDEAPIYLGGEIFKNLFFGMLQIETTVQVKRER